ncbi:hypothetical protein [Bacillus cereus group sp. BfR-BA-01518]|uniref:hypothetical protein n=1 Tax=Bacillus cereus group sp. BfR-BA-01518 TaxID=2920368 RepID=UPI001F58A4B6|nr:hypothetical protein [Bacillus cereus group sp. BfR-BA-01518]
MSKTLNNKYHMNFIDKKCSIDSDINLINEWESFIDPYIDIQNNYEKDNEKIHFIVKEDSTKIKGFSASLNGKQDIELHCDLYGKVILENNLETIIFIDSLRVAYYIQKNKDGFCITYYYEKFSNEISLDLLRIVRGILIALIERDGLTKVHMATVANDKNAICFIGGEGAGKTSFMLSFLKQIENSRFVTNDKALIDLTKNDGNLSVWGTPYAISIGNGALQSSPEIEVTSKTRVINNEAYFWPNELKQHLNREIQTHAKVSFIFVVTINPKLDHLEYEIIHESQTKREFIQQYVLNFSDRIAPNWLNNFIGICPEVQEKAEDLFLNIPIIKLYGNPWDGNLKRILVDVFSEFSNHQSV